MLNLIFFIVKILAILLPVVISVAYYTLLERKILASVQRRRGPNVVGFWGLLQPIADGLKLGIKEFIIPKRANVVFFILSPLWIFLISFSNWCFMPFGFDNFFSNFSYGSICLLVTSSLVVYGVIMAGWSSHSYYSFLGGLRSAAQIISYEISISLILLPVFLYSGSFNLIDIVYFQHFYSVYFILPFLPLAIMFFVCILAESNRTPFDLPEAEAELVAGFNVEYSATPFALFFLGEYCNILLMSCIYSIFFLGGWNSFFFISGTFSLAFKTLLLAFLFVYVRACLPRYRYDQLMKICWEYFLPVSFSLTNFWIIFLVFVDLCE